MKKNCILLIATILLTIHAFAQPTFTWAKKVGGTGDEVGYSIAIDGSGNVYTTGYFGGTVDFDPGAGTFNLTSAGGQDIYISKLDALGNFVWAKKMGGTSTDGAWAIALDGSGNVYTTGYFNNTVDFDPGPGAANLTSAGLLEAFICKLDASGNFVWAKRIGDTGTDCGNSIALDASANVYTAGSFEGTVDFDPGVGTFNLTSAGGQDNYISKLDANGNFVWAKRIGGVGYDLTYAITCDASGNVHTTGHFNGTVDFDPGAGTFNLNGAGGTDVFISKLDALGNFIWAKSMGGAGTDFARSVTVDISGNVYTTGAFMNTTDFDPGAGTFNLTSAGQFDVFISKLDANGNFVWAQKMGGTDIEESLSLKLDGSGNVYTSGYFRNTADFDPGVGVFNLTSAGINDVFISKLDVNGNFVWIQQMGGTDDDRGWSIALDGSGNVYTSGYFRNSVDFDPGVGVFNLTSAGGYDIFVHKMGDCAGAPVQPGAISGPVTICEGTTNTYSVTVVAGASSYTWTLPGGWSGTSVTNSINATASATSGNITVTANNACGSSIAQTLAVTVNPIYTTNTTAAICQGDSILLAGAYKKIAGNYSDILQSMMGCDSTVITALTVNPLPTVTLSNQNAVCMNAPAFALSGGAPVGGTYSGVGVNNNQFDPAVAGAGTHTITYSYSDPNTGCSNSSTNTIVVNPLPTVSLGAFTAVCADAAAFALTGGLPAGGTYSGVGVNNNQFDPAVAGAGTHTITYTYTDGNTGCSNSATNTIVVNPLPPTPIITVNGTTFTSSAANGNQWYLNGSAINGATNQTFICTGNGNYTVCVTDANGCKSCSAVLNFTTFGMSENENENEINIYPNPFSSTINVIASPDASLGTWQSFVIIYNTLGEIIYSTQLTAQPLAINLEEVSTGIYFLQMKNERGIVTKKIIKQ